MIDTRILIGLSAILVTISSLVYIGLGEAERQAEFERAFHGRSIETGAGLFTEFCAPCHGLKGEGGPRGSNLNSQYFFKNRLDELNYQGSLESYISLTIAGGRPVMSIGYFWPENMPTWSIDYGGSLRNDEIKAIVDYILNWEEEAGSIESIAESSVAGDTPDGTPEERGRNIFQMSGCLACHAINGEGGNIAPDLTNVYAEQGEDFIHQSILKPNTAISEGFQANIMPPNYADRLSEQDLDDIVAYLKSVVGN